jgi:hypothetical protein
MIMVGVDFHPQTSPHRRGRVVQRPRLPTAAAVATGGGMMAVKKALRLPLFIIECPESIPT